MHDRRDRHPPGRADARSDRSRPSIPARAVRSRRARSRSPAEAPRDDVTPPLSLVASPTAPFAVRGFDVDLSPTAAGLPPTRAGVAPMAVTTLVRSVSQANPFYDSPDPFYLVIAPTENLRDVTVHVPPGFVGNPTATGVRCTAAQLTTPARFNGIGSPSRPARPRARSAWRSSTATTSCRVYNLEPPPGLAGRVRVLLQQHRRDAAREGAAVRQRHRHHHPEGGQFRPAPEVRGDAVGRAERSVARPAARHLPAGRHRLQPDHRATARSERAATSPFLRTPTSCPGTPLQWGIDMNTYQHAGHVPSQPRRRRPRSRAASSTRSIRASRFVPSTQAPHAPTGVDATCRCRRTSGINGIAPADLRRATVTLPPGPDDQPVLGGRAAGLHGRGPAD